MSKNYQLYTGDNAFEIVLELNLKSDWEDETEGNNFNLVTVLKHGFGLG